MQRIFSDAFILQSCLRDSYYFGNEIYEINIIKVTSDIHMPNVSVCNMLSSI